MGVIGVGVIGVGFGVGVVLIAIAIAIAVKVAVASIPKQPAGLWFLQSLGVIYFCQLEICNICPGTETCCFVIMEINCRNPLFCNGNRLWKSIV